MIERENTPMTTSSDVIAGLELALASADAMIERLQGERAILRDSAKDVIAWCDANPPYNSLKHDKHGTEEMGMRKTTEELAREATNNEPMYGRREFTFSRAELETFRRLAVENERECAEPDPRDEALRLAKTLLENLTTYDARPSNIWKYFYASSTGDYVNLREVKEQAKPVLAAIDAVTKG